nr:RNA-directed DNA polymerase, eukaryota [Tanacetum cinerariifolium]
MAQKAEIRWAIEGDENTKYFHGIINKKRSQLAIRGVLVNGDWIEEPSKVKDEFLNHFANPFSKPDGPLKINIIKSTIIGIGTTKEEVNSAAKIIGCSTLSSPFKYLGVKRGWIQGCLNSKMGSITVNGSPSSEFSFHKDLKQGDPFSPFLFIVANAISLVHTLNCFYMASGLKINIIKSTIIGIGTTKEEVNSAAKIIGCSTLSSPFKYLGVKVGSSSS